jgi:diguanylate cyclase (GGDEF)-like protein
MRKIAKIILITSGLIILFFVGWSFTPGYPVDLGDLYTSIALNLFALLTAVYGFSMAANKSFPRALRRAWALISLSSIAGFIAESIFVYFRYIQGTSPFPSIADYFYLLSYPILLAGILALPYAPQKKDQRLLLSIDMTIVVVVSAVFLWYFILAGLVAQGIPGEAGLVSMAYPVVDLLILAGLVSLIQRETQDIGRTIILLLTGGMLFGIVADVLFALYTTYGWTFPTSAVLDVFWMLGRFGFLAAAVWQLTHPVVETQERENFPPLLKTNLLYITVPTGLGLAILAVVSLIGPNLRLYGALAGVAGIIGLVLIRQFFVLRENRHLSNAMEQLAVTDGLTGLANRRSFNDALEKEMVRAQRYNRPLSLLMMDINNFKKYNDSRGHPAGDKLLKDFARLIKSQLRVTDIVARYGGDEFVIILPETDDENTRLIVDRLHGAVTVGLPQVEGIGTSIGFAALQPEMTSVSLLELADQAMYRDKPVNARR